MMYFNLGVTKTQYDGFISKHNDVLIKASKGEYLTPKEKQQLKRIQENLRLKKQNKR